MRNFLVDLAIFLGVILMFTGTLAGTFLLVSNFFGVWAGLGVMALLELGWTVYFLRGDRR